MVKPTMEEQFEQEESNYNTGRKQQEQERIYEGLRMKEECNDFKEVAKSSDYPYLRVYHLICLHQFECM